MPPWVLPLLALAFGLSACGHVPLASLPRLMQIDFRTTSLPDLRATILIPHEIRPLPGSARLTIKVNTGRSRFERSTLLEEVTERAELSALPMTAPHGMRLIVYRLAPSEAAKLGSFRAEVLAGAGASGRNEMTIGVAVEKFCFDAPLPEGPALMTSYLRTSETRQYVPVARNVDLKTLAAEAGIDTGTVLTPCGS